MFSDRNVVIERMARLLAGSARRALKEFLRDHPNEHAYAFTFVAPPEGTHVLTAFATEEGLTRVAKTYLKLGYGARRGDPLAVLRTWLRWANPDDGWYYYWPSKSFDAAWMRPYSRGTLRLYDGVAERICLRVIKDLRRSEAFFERLSERPVIAGFTYGEDPEDFARFARRVTSKARHDQLRREMVAGLRADRKVIRPAAVI